LRSSTSGSNDATRKGFSCTKPVTRRRSIPRSTAVTRFSAALTMRTTSPSTQIP